MANKIIGQEDRIVAVSKCIEIDYEFGWGGNGAIVYVGELLHIETKYGTSYTGFLIDYEKASKEGMQDCLVIRSQDGKDMKVGIYDIILMERTK
jgi:hypothetical protein